MRPIRLLSALLFALVVGTSAAWAGGTDDFGDYQVHYNAFPSDTLTPQIATAYGIVRSKNQAILNIAVTRKRKDQPGLPVPAYVNITAANLNGQVKSVRMKQIHEENAVYYLGLLSVNDGETLVFDIDVTPEGQTDTHHVHFQQTFVAD